MTKVQSNVVMKLWGVADTTSRIDVVCPLFKSEKELISELGENVDLKKVCTVELLKKFKGRSSVLKRKTMDGRVTYFVAIDKDGYAIYNSVQSRNLDRSIWNFEYGSLRELYSEFRDKGVHIENDVYAKNDAYWEQVSQLVKKNGLFSSKK